MSQPTNNHLPRGVSVKVQHLRPRYPDLQSWCESPGHVLVTRPGRVFITDATGAKRVFNYPGSPWSNPFKLSDHTLSDALSQYRAYLQDKLKDPKTLEAFLVLRNAKELGCFCDPGAPCHRDVILNVLSTLPSRSRTESGVVAHLF